MMNNVGTCTPIHFPLAPAESSHENSLESVSEDCDSPLRDALRNQQYTWDKRVIVARAREILKLRGKKSTSCQTLDKAFTNTQETQTYGFAEAAVGKDKDAIVDTSEYGYHLI
jgi:hypothetical protein